MKLTTSIRAGARGCSPEAQYYMEKAIALDTKISRCLANANTVTPPNNGYNPTYTGATYPDRSGWCG